MSGRKPLLICDLTQSYSPSGGGGIGVYLAEKRRYVLEQTEHRLLQIVPGPEDRIVENGRHIWCEIGAEPVRGSPNYRFIMRKDKVREVLAQYRPDIIESMCPWVLPWVAIRHRRKFPETALVAGYHTDFPDAHVEHLLGWRIEACRGQVKASRKTLSASLLEKRRRKTFLLSILHRVAIARRSSRR